MVERATISVSAAIVLAVLMLIGIHLWRSRAEV